MPIIPIIKRQRPTTDAPSPVLDRERRPTLDTGEVQAGLRRVNEAGKMPLVNPQAMAAPFEALGTVGRAIQQAGDVLGALAIQRERAEADFQAAEFEKRMDIELAEFERWKTGKLNTPGEWEPEWGKRLGKLRSEFGANEKLNRLAKEQIGLRLTRWEGQSMAGVARDATKHTFALAKSAKISAADSALQSGDFARHEEIIQSGLTKGYLFPHEATHERQRSIQEQVRRAKMAADTALEGPNPRLEDARKAIQESPMPEEEKRLELARLSGRFERQKERHDLLTIANDDPDRAAELAVESEKAGKISGLDRVEIVGQAMQSKAFRRRSAVGEYKERISLGDIPTADELTTDTRLSEFDRASLAALATGEVNNPAEFEAALVSALNFDATAYATEGERITAAANIEAAFESRFTGPYLSTLKAELDKRKQRSFDSPSSETDIGPALKLLDEAVQGGGLDGIVGPVLKPKLDPETGKPVMREPKESIGFINVPGRLWGLLGERKIDVPENEGKPVPLMEKDAVASEKAAAIQREIRRTIEAEVKSGALKTQADITRRALDLFTMKGGKMPPVSGGAETQNLLLPPLNSEKTDLNELLKKYGH